MGPQWEAQWGNPPKEAAVAVPPRMPMSWEEREGNKAGHIPGPRSGFPSMDMVRTQLW